jgi:intracellular septation protein A
LGKNLRASLDLNHRAATEIVVTIKKLQNYGLSVPQFVMAIMLVVMGVFTYYVAPTAFLYGKYELFFTILNSVLIMMILGLTFVAILILPAL